MARKSKFSQKNAIFQLPNPQGACGSSVAAHSVCSLPRLRYRMHTSLDQRRTPMKKASLFNARSATAIVVFRKPGVRGSSKCLYLSRFWGCVNPIARLRGRGGEGGGLGTSLRVCPVPPALAGPSRGKRSSVVQRRRRGERGCFARRPRGGSEAPSVRDRRRSPVGRNGSAGEDRTPILRQVTRADEDRAIRLTLIQKIFPAGERLDLLPMLLECRLRPQPVAIGKMIVERLA